MKNEYGLTFRQLRKERGLTQEEVANIIGWTSKQMVSNIERGLCFFPPEALAKLGRVSGFPTKKLAEIQIEAKVAAIKKKYGKLKK